MIPTNTLVETEAVKFNFMDKTKVPDGESGFISAWVVGAEFDATMRIDTSTEAQVAKAQNLIAGITFFVSKNIELDYYDVIRRASDGKTFRITSDPHKTPSKSKLDLRTVTAEPWDIPDPWEVTP